MTYAEIRLEMIRLGLLATPDQPGAPVRRMRATFAGRIRAEWVPPFTPEQMDTFLTLVSQYDGRG